MKKAFPFDMPQMLITLLSVISIAIIAFIFLFVFSKAWPVFQHNGLSYFISGGFDKQISDAFYSSADDPSLSFGMLGLILGTLLTTTFSLIIAGLMGVGASIFICEYTSGPVSQILLALVRLLASIPSVIFGLIGIVTVVPVVEKLLITIDMQIAYIPYFQMTGKNMLSAIIVLTFMIVPTVISLSADAIKAVPPVYKEIGYSFGMRHFRVVYKIILPSARSGIIAGLILAAGRGIGESIAVSMVCGGLGIIPKAGFGFINFLAPTLPLAPAIINKSEAMGSMPVEAALFSCGATLLVIGAFLSIGAGVVQKQLRKAAGYHD
ncbi:MAG: phosphate ABC transporter permease subunit PstC [Clostridiales bacterium]|nr:phosphate ABC transporter permease subunit PstC [Clostridiales bacterium]